MVICEHIYRFFWVFFAYLFMEKRFHDFKNNLELRSRRSRTKFILGLAIKFFVHRKNQSVSQRPKAL